MLYVHPDFAGEGVGSAIADALEKIAGARGAEAVTVDASDTAVPFFEDRGYTAVQRNSVPRDDQWLSNTTMIKPLKDNQSKAPPPAKPS
jgi:putative acetyltransferase